MSPVYAILPTCESVCVCVCVCVCVYILVRSEPVSPHYEPMSPVYAILPTCESVCVCVCVHISEIWTKCIPSHSRAVFYLHTCNNVKTTHHLPMNLVCLDDNSEPEHKRRRISREILIDMSSEERGNCSMDTKGTIHEWEQENTFQQWIQTFFGSNIHRQMSFNKKNVE